MSLSRAALVLAGLLTTAAGCATTPPLFPGISNVSELGPDERVVIGQVQYANHGDISTMLPMGYDDSWLNFSYDLWHQQSPKYQSTAPHRPSFGPRGGVFVFRAKRSALYLESIMVVTSSYWKGKEAFWALPIFLKLPPTSASCSFVGTIVLEVSGDKPEPPSLWKPQLVVTGNAIRATVVDSFDRDRAALSTYVDGCVPQRALAITPPREEVEALLAPAIADAEARQAKWDAEAAKTRKNTGSKGGR